MSRDKSTLEYFKMKQLKDAVLYYGAAAGRGGVGEDIAVLDTGYYLSQVELQKSLI